MPAPTTVVSFGPNGTHYPPSADAPWFGDTVPNVVVVECNWAAIKTGINSFTAAQVAAGAKVLVKPGSLTGNGAGSGATPSLGDAGNAAWTRAVLVFPRDGYGSITGGTGARIDNVKRVAFVGFKSDAWVITNCNKLIVAWSRFVSGPNINTSNADIDLYEVVSGDRKDPNDTRAIRPSGTTTVLRVREYGCAVLPSVKPDGHPSHCDSMQLERTGTGGRFGDFLFQDSVYYGSSNGVFVASSSDSLTFRHTLVLGSSSPWLIYPLAPGDYVGAPNAINGNATNVDLFDSIVYGSIGSVNYRRVLNTKIHYQPQASQAPSLEGAWSYDPAMQNWTASNITAISPKPTDARLTSIWTGTAAPPAPVGDTTAPTIAFVTPSGTVSGTVSIVVEATDNVGVTGVRFSTGSIDLGAGVKGSGNQWALTFNAGGVPEGTYPVVARAVDAAGNSATAERSFTVGASTPTTNLPPTVTLLSPVDTAVLPSDAPTLFRAKAVDDNYVGSLTFWAKPGDVLIGTGTPTGNDDLYELTVYPEDLPPGITGVFAEASDTGSPSLSAESPVFSVTLAPTVDRTLPSEFDLNSSNVTATSLTITADESIDVNGQPIVYQLFDIGNVYGAPQSSRLWNVGGLTPGGRYVFRVEASDPDGNIRNSELLPITLPVGGDTTAPSAPTVGIPTVGITSITYSWAGASDNVAVAGYDAYIDNVKVNSELLLVPTCEVSGLYPGITYDFYVIAKDAAGNSSPASNIRTATTLTETNPPTVAPQQPGVGTIPAGTVQFRYQAIDTESGIKRADVYDQANNLVGIGSLFGNDIWGFDVASTSISTLTSYTVRVEDWSGNITTSAARAVTVATPAPVDTTGPVGGITDPVDGTVVVPPFFRVKVSASDLQSGISSVSLRSSTRGELGEATLTSPGIYEAEFPDTALLYGVTEMFARIINGVGVVYDSPSITLIRDEPVESPTARGWIVGPWLDGAFEPILKGRLTIRQRVPFPNDLGYVTTAGVEIEVREGKFYRKGVEGPVPIGFPPLNLGFEVDEEPGGGGHARLGLVKTFPYGTVDGDQVPYGALDDLEVEGMPSNAYLPDGVINAIAAVERLEDLIEELETQAVTVAESNGVITITTGD